MIPTTIPIILDVNITEKTLKLRCNKTGGNPKDISCGIFNGT
ncbi:MAG: hypothetical protein QM489_06800 [Candidatus Izemoplasma sp.]